MERQPCIRLREIAPFRTDNLMQEVGDDADAGKVAGAFVEDRPVGPLERNRGHDADKIGMVAGDIIVQDAPERTASVWPMAEEISNPAFQWRMTSSVKFSDCEKIRSST